MYLTLFIIICCSRTQRSSPSTVAIRSRLWITQTNFFPSSRRTSQVRIIIISLHDNNIVSHRCFRGCASGVSVDFTRLCGSKFAENVPDVRGPATLFFFFSFGQWLETKWKVFYSHGPVGRCSGGTYSFNVTVCARAYRVFASYVKAYIDCNNVIRWFDDTLSTTLQYFTQESIRSADTTHAI